MWSKETEHNFVNGKCDCGEKNVKTYSVKVSYSQPTPYSSSYTVSGGGNYKVGQSVTLSASGPSYFGQVKFAGWEINVASVKDKNSKTIKFDMPAHDVDAVAKWEYKEEPIEYNITLTTNKIKFSDQKAECAEGETRSIKLPGTSSDKIESVDITGVSNYSLSGKMLTFTMPGNDVTIKVNYK